MSSGTKIVCQACGARNDLGRMFCTGCGHRLDLSHTSLGELKDKAAGGTGGRIRRALLRLLALAVLIGAALALWAPAPLEAPGIESGRRTVPQKLEGLQIALQGKRQAAATFSEQELNGFLADKAAEFKLRAVRVQLREGAFEVTAFRPFGGPIELPKLGTVRLGLAWDLTGTAEGGVVKVRRARLGHLPLPGPLAAVAANCLARPAGRLVPGLDALRAGITAVRLKPGQVEIQVGG